MLETWHCWFLEHWNRQKSLIFANFCNPLIKKTWKMLSMSVRLFCLFQCYRNPQWWCHYLNLLKGIFWMFTKCHTFSCCNGTEYLTILRFVNKQKRHFLRFRTFSTYSNLDVWTGFKWIFLIDSQFHICTVSQWRVSALSFSI